MNAPGADRNLLLGLLALQLDFLERDQLIAALGAWALAKHKSLGEHLVERGFLPRDRLQRLESLVDERIAESSNSSAASGGADPEALSDGTTDAPPAGVAATGDGATRTSDHVLSGALSDPELLATLAHLSSSRVELGSGSGSPAGSVGAPTGTGGRFRIVRPHAQGGLGRVLVAQDEELHREVALKEIRPEFAGDESRRARFTLEAEITGALEHPGIVPVYGLGAYPDGRPFYAMRLIRGESLQDAIRSFHQDAAASGERGLQLRKLLQRFIAVCHAVEYAHSRGVLHRDLKPANIMLGKYGETLVVDWGLAKARDAGATPPLVAAAEEGHLQPISGSDVDATQMGTVVGTYQYMSPEQAAGLVDRLGPATDVFSLGATLYQILTGQPPIVGTTRGELQARALACQYVDPQSVAPQWPRPLHAICRRAMSAAPESRYASPLALADDLEHWLADEPVTASPDTLADRCLRFGRRHRTAVLAAGVGLALVAIVSIVAGVVVEQKRRETARLASANALLADEKGALALLESEAREDAERQLLVATAERLAAQSSEQRLAYPVRGALLAVAAAEVHERRGERLLPSAENAIRAALQNLGGRPLAADVPIECALATGDSRWFLAGCTDGALRVWNARRDSLEPVHTVPAHGTPLAMLAESPNSRWIASASRDGEVRLWRPTDSNPLASSQIVRKASVPVGRLRFSPDNRFLAVIDDEDSRVSVWTLGVAGPSIEPRAFRGPDGTINNLLFARDGRRIFVVGHEPEIRVWDLRNDASEPTKPVSSDAQPQNSPNRESIEPTLWPGHEEPIFAIAQSADGRWLYTASGDRSIRAWDLRAERPEQSSRVLIGHLDLIFGLAVDPRGRWLASGSWDRTIRLWKLNDDGPTGESVVLRGHSEAVQRVAFTPDGQWLISGADDAHVRLWDPAAADPSLGSRVWLGHEGVIDSLSLSGDGRSLVTRSTDASARVWSVPSPRQAVSPLEMTGGSTPVHAVAIEPHGRAVAVVEASQVARVWRLTSGLTPRIASATVLDEARPTAASVAWSPDGKWLVLGGSGLKPEALVFDFDQDEELKRPRRLAGHTDAILAILFHPDGKRLATGSIDGTVRIWDLTATASAAPLTLRAFEGSVRRLAWSADGRWLAASGDERVTVTLLWDQSSADRAVAEPERLAGPPGAIEDLAISGDGEWLAAGGADGVTRLWRLGERRGERSPYLLRGHLENVMRVAFLDQSKRLATASWDRTIRVWDLPERGRSEFPPPTVLSGHESAVLGLAELPETGQLISASSDRTIRLWDLAANHETSEQRVLRGHAGGVRAIAVTPDGKWLVSGADDGVARVWPLETSTLLKLARGYAGRALTELERQAYRVETLPTASQDEQ